MANTNLFTRIFSSLAPFDLSQLEDFPYTAFSSQKDYYQILDDWYEGRPLEVYTVDKSTGKPIETFPIKINPLKQTCAKHAATVVGQNVDSIRFGGMPFQMLPTIKPKTKAAKIKDALTKTFTKSAFGATFLSNCITAQYLGGSLIQANWLPLEKRIEISTPNVREFFGIPDRLNYWSLREAWIVREINELDARSLGYETNTGENKFFYLEYWNKKSYKVMINGTVLKFPGTDIEQSGENPFAVVPMIYIPHIRTKSFLGESIITEAVKGLIREMNLRMADIGDAVSDDSHNIIAVRNIRGNIQTINIDGRSMQNLGGGAGIGNENDPDMFAVSTKSASEPMIRFNTDLYKIYRRETNHPAVADGEDEGSQRSSLTLNVRMAPLVSEAEMERLFYSVGLNFFCNILLKMMFIKGIFEITEDMTDIDFTVQWQSMLPKDREALTQEVAVRSKNKLGSLKTLMGLFNDIEDIDEEMNSIKDEKELTAPVSPFGAKPPGDDNKQPPSSKDVKEKI
jgi:hypothetical protein